MTQRDYNKNFYETRCLIENPFLNLKRCEPLPSDMQKVHNHFWYYSYKVHFFYGHLFRNYTIQQLGVVVET